MAKDLRGLPKKDVARILECFEKLAKEPRGRGCEKLSSRERYRIRRGIYRIVYEIFDDELVVKVGHKREIYGGR